MTRSNNSGGEGTDDAAVARDRSGGAVLLTDGGTETTANDSDQTVAGILAILLGWLGAHKFYQGNMKMGILYLCLSWTMVVPLIALVEGILILVADEEEYRTKWADGSILGR